MIRLQTGSAVKGEVAVMQHLSYSLRRTPTAPTLPNTHTFFLVFSGGSCSTVLQFQAMNYLGMPDWPKRIRAKCYFSWVDFDKKHVGINEISQVSCSCLEALGLMTWCLASLHRFAMTCFVTLFSASFLFLLSRCLLKLWMCQGRNYPLPCIFDNQTLVLVAGSFMLPGKETPTPLAPKSQQYHQNDQKLQ